MNTSDSSDGRPVSGRDSQITRRSFLQTTSVAAGGAALGALSVERSAHAQGSDTVKVALVGCWTRVNRLLDRSCGTGYATNYSCLDCRKKVVAGCPDVKVELSNVCNR